VPATAGRRVNLYMSHVSVLKKPWHGGLGVKNIPPLALTYTRRNREPPKRKVKFMATALIGVSSTPLQPKARPSAKRSKSAGGGGLPEATAVR
jgi:hypothetical protein